MKCGYQGSHCGSHVFDQDLSGEELSGQRGDSGQDPHMGVTQPM